jgi:hypothetical protein
VSIYGDGRGCNMDYGRFVINDIHVDGSGNADRFWGLYEQHCESPGAPALFGEVRLNEPATGAAETVEPAAIDWPNTPVGSTGIYVPVTRRRTDRRRHLVGSAHGTRRRRLRYRVGRLCRHAPPRGR